MNEFAVVVPYFGQFKPSIKLFLESCNRNPEVDWFFFTDCQVPNRVALHRNVHWISSTLENIRRLAEDKLGQKAALYRSYKLCDLKPFYGAIFGDYLAGYSYWGYGDVDVIYGRLNVFLSEIKKKQYDKINWMGHLCFIRNTKETNSVPFLHKKGTLSAEEVLAAEKNLGFDERDFNLKCLESGMKIYTGRWAADIDIFYWRMRCVSLGTLRCLLDIPYIKWAPTNYSKQVFALVDGAVYRIYLKRGKVHREEFAYIHFRKEVPIRLDCIACRTFLITREGFFSVPEGERALLNYTTVKQLILKFNNQENRFQELYCFGFQLYRKVTGKRGW